MTKPSELLKQMEQRIEKLEDKRVSVKEQTPDTLRELELEKAKVEREIHEIRIKKEINKLKNEKLMLRLGLKK